MAAIAASDERGCQEKFFSLDSVADVLSAPSPFDGLLSWSVVVLPGPPAMQGATGGRASFAKPGFHPVVVTTLGVAEAGQA